MDGYTLLREILDFLDRGESDIPLLGPRRIYSCLDEAACQFARITGAITGEAVITSVADQQSYDLPPDFIRPLVKSGSERYLGRFVTTDGVTAWVPKTDYSRIFLANQTEAKDIPGLFCVTQRATASSAISGTVTAAASPSAGLVELVDGGADFSSVMVRDVVYNISKNTWGLVISVVSGTRLSCAMFPSSRASFVIGNDYVVRPESREQLLFDAPCANSGDVLTLPSVVLPPPVYHDYGFLGLAPEACRAVAAEAAYIFAARTTGMKQNPEHHNLFIKELNQNKIDRALAILQGSPDRG